MFALIRLLTGIGYQGMYVVGMVLIAELMPAAYRGRARAWIVGCGAIGPGTLAWVAYALVPISHRAGARST
ncbi:MAG: hypothetical protein ACRDRN_14470 [Sciscionella sp.]